MEFTARQIAEYVQGIVVGDENATIHTFAKIEEGTPGALSFLSNPKYTPYIYQTKSTIVLVGKDFSPEQAISATLIKVDNAYESLAKLMTLYEQTTPRHTGIDALAYVSPTAKLGRDVTLYPFSYVGDGAVIGDGTILYPHATVYHDCRVGSNCILHAGCVIGADGFGFAPTDKGYEKIPQIGIVILEDDVEIGANTCVDRATMGATVIHKGVKLDNLIQIAHNVEVGSHTVMASQTGVAGSTKIGEWCMFGGQCGIAGHISIGNKVQLGAQSGVPGRVADGQVLMGYPAINSGNFMKSSVVFKKLPDIYATIHKLEKEVEALKQALGQR